MSSQNTVNQAQVTPGANTNAGSSSTAQPSTGAAQQPTGGQQPAANQSVMMQNYLNQPQEAGSKIWYKSP